MRRVYGRLYVENTYYDIVFSSVQALRESKSVADKYGLTLIRIKSTDIKPTRRAEIKEYQIPRKSGEHFEEWLNRSVVCRANIVSDQMRGLTQ